MEVRNVTKAYGDLTVLKEFSCTFSEGITCILGPSGRGKTTLLRLLMGLEKPDSGEVLGNTLRFAPVFQEDRLLEHLTALGNLRFILGRDYREAEAREILHALGLRDWEGKPVRDFSGGMKRRLSLARALLAKSDALILDEPFAGLDEENKKRAIACIRAAGKQTVLVTHDKQDAEALGAEMLYL